MKKQSRIFIGLLLLIGSMIFPVCTTEASVKSAVPCARVPEMLTDTGKIKVWASVLLQADADGNVSVSELKQGTGNPQMDDSVLEIFRSIKQEEYRSYFSAAFDEQGKLKAEINWSVSFIISYKDAKNRPATSAKLVEQVQPYEDAPSYKPLWTLIFASLDATGKVIDARTDRLSSGNEAYNQMAAELIKKKWKFEPARDAAGNPVPDEFACIVYFGHVRDQFRNMP